MGFGGCFNGFGGWHDGGYCGCGGCCWPAAWWVCYLAVLVSFFSLWQLGIFKIFFMVVVRFQTQGNGEEKWVNGDGFGFGCVDAGG